MRCETGRLCTWRCRCSRPNSPRPFTTIHDHSRPFTTICDHSTYFRCPPRSVPVRATLSRDTNSSARTQHNIVEQKFKEYVLGMCGGCAWVASRARRCGPAAWWTSTAAGWEGRETGLRLRFDGSGRETGLRLRPDGRDGAGCGRLWCERKSTVPVGHAQACHADLQAQ